MTTPAPSPSEAPAPSPAPVGVLMYMDSANTPWPTADQAVASNCHRNMVAYLNTLAAGDVPAVGGLGGADTSALATCLLRDYTMTPNV